ncbi:hypothetical protein EZ449_10645 [Pedobacter frigidisoli]|uniref:Uracil DNA glycosylase superfamily protein n=1 Tax=Pedobacter frigidisoli TaxID=2530455 RepID=A0A4R0P713_9SPHI|nr:hypothetical protein [Pedobacter frigidisoli]TCD10269.1 hypothetical protein EZ449_10645 [Pedobacter frigidisoli]
MNEKISNWLEEVSNGCHEIASKNETYPDFYVFQSEIFENPDLLIIGANPAGVKTYKEAKEQKGITKRTKSDLSSGKNMYLANPDWAISKPVLKIFNETIKLNELLKKALIMNVVYFNSNQVSDLKINFGDDGKKMINFCKQKTQEFIKLVRPKNIIFLGSDAPKWLKIKFGISHNVLTIKEGTKELYLIQKIHFENIPCYLMHHPSRNPKFNNPDNLRLKSEYLDKHL